MQVSKLKHLEAITASDSSFTEIKRRIDHAKAGFQLKQMSTDINKQQSQLGWHRLK